MKKILVVLAASLLTCCTALAQRLPGGAFPQHYTLTVNINFSNNTFDGDETINLNLTKPTNTITLNALEIDFHNVSVTAAGQTQTAKVSLDEKNEQATFTVPNQLPAGPAKVHILYTGQLNDKLRGFYLSTYKGRKYEVSQMESTDARVAFPCFDEPAYKATFDITAIVDKGDTAISNGEIVSDTPGPGDQHTIKFATSPKMSSYLVALTVGDWKCVSDHTDGVKVSVCTVPGQENLAAFPLAAVKAILHYYDSYYGIKYPLPKLDNIAVPDFQAGAMENWGAIIYRETALLVDEKTASVGMKQGVAETIAHEMAHQWFGDLVTMEWWDDIWLNEGFATWMTPHPLAQWKPEWMAEPGCCGRSRSRHGRRLRAKYASHSSGSRNPRRNRATLRWHRVRQVGCRASHVGVLPRPRYLPRRCESLSEGTRLRQRDRGRFLECDGTRLEEAHRRDHANVRVAAWRALCRRRCQV